MMKSLSHAIHEQETCTNDLNLLSSYKGKRTINFSTSFSTLRRMSIRVSRLPINGSFSPSFRPIRHRSRPLKGTITAMITRYTTCFSTFRTRLFRDRPTRHLRNKHRSPPTLGLTTRPMTSFSNTHHTIHQFRTSRSYRHVSTPSHRSQIYHIIRRPYSSLLYLLRTIHHHRRQRPTSRIFTLNICNTRGHENIPTTRQARQRIIRGQGHFRNVYQF